MKKTLLNNIEISTFCSQIAMLLQAGIAPSDGVQILVQDMKSEEGKALLEQILESTSQGESFRDSLAATGVFPDYVLHMTELGEESGNLEKVMAALAEHYEREESIRENIKSAITYPSTMICMMLLVILVLITKVLPIFQQVFVQLGSEMNGFALSLLRAGNVLRRYSFLFIGLLVVLVLFGLYAAKSEKGRKGFKRLLSHIGPVNSLYEKLAIGRFASGMALTLSSGLDIFGSLKMVASMVDHAEVEKKIEKCSQYLMEGPNFAEALAKAEVFNSLYSRMVSVGVRTGSVDTVMSKIADQYEQETNRKIQSLISILEPTLVIILSLIVGLILMSVILPLMGIMSSIG